MKPDYTRGFRLHHNGRILHGAEFPTGHALVVDDPEYGFCTSAHSLDELLKGYHGARAEWPHDQLVPTELLLDLVTIATHPGSFTPPAKPYPADAVRAVLDQLTKYLGYDVAERAAEQEANRALAQGETHL
ncbi:hypothetical protein ABZT17_26890 [Streptomyces sp. NPDC005648]|uniref:hypothetical protein n=1 Tax=Streptomyces sp. NPDC005648 TaxID=3157044 RepID=UPI0033A54CAE